MQDKSFILNELKRIDNYSCKYYSGTLTMTGGGGDVTVNIPFDWSGGYLIQIGSLLSANWADTGAGNWIRLSTSYDSITGSYTGGHIINEATDDNALYVHAKTVNFFGMPKSATSTTVVFDDNGTTRYLKYFIWA